MGMESDMDDETKNEGLCADDHVPPKLAKIRKGCYGHKMQGTSRLRYWHVGSSRAL